MTRTKDAAFVPPSYGPVQLESGWRSGDLLADGSHIAREPSGCVLCDRGISTGERAATLAGGRGLAHVSGCVANMRAPR